MTRICSLLAIAMAVAACAGGEAGDPLDDSGFENVGDDTAADLVGDIEWRVRDEPQLLELGSDVTDAVAYSECEQVEPQDPGTDLEFHCTRPWAEVAWYVIPADIVSAGRAAGGTTLTATFSVAGNPLLVRASIHEVAPDGSKTKLATRAALFDSDSISAPLRADLDYYIYVARGQTLLPVWGTGTVEYTIRASID